MENGPRNPNAVVCLTSNHDLGQRDCWRFVLTTLNVRPFRWDLPGIARTRQSFHCAIKRVQAPSQKCKESLTAVKGSKSFTIDFRR